jgi:purine-binding chemotaxis protein CheW
LVSIAGVEPGAKGVLVVVAQGKRYALPLDHVLETMRPLPIEPVANSAPYVLGVSVIRGMPVPVVDLGALLTTAKTPSHAAHARLVMVRAGSRHVALAVESVIGVRRLEPRSLHEMPPLLRASSPASISGFGVPDRELLAVLDGGCLVPDEVWANGLANG